MMQEFQYCAVTPQGIRQTGVLRAETPAEVSARLDRMGLIPLRVQARGEGFLSSLRGRARRVPLAEMILFTRELSTLYRAGIPFLRALGILADQASHPALRRVIEAVRTDLHAGLTLSEAFGRQQRAFGKLFCSSIHTGEATGHFDEVLDRLALFMEREMKTREELRDAMRYPVLVVAALGIAFAVLVGFVFPKFTLLFSRYNSELPLPTRVLMGISALIRQRGYLVLPAVLLGGAGLAHWLRTERGAARFDELRLRLPVLGSVFVKVALARFAHTLGLLVRSGLPLVQALGVVRETIGNRRLAREVETLEHGFAEGRDVTAIMERSPFFPPLAVQMFAVGTESGALDRMLAELAAHYDREVEYATRRLSKLVEPALTVLLGGAVLFFALSVFLPMWNLLEVFRR